MIKLDYNFNNFPSRVNHISHEYEKHTRRIPMKNIILTASVRRNRRDIKNMCIIDFHALKWKMTASASFSIVSSAASMFYEETRYILLYESRCRWTCEMKKNLNYATYHGWWMLNLICTTCWCFRLIFYDIFGFHSTFWERFCEMKTLTLTRLTFKCILTKSIVYGLHICSTKIIAK